MDTSPTSSTRGLRMADTSMSPTATVPLNTPSDTFCRNRETRPEVPTEFQGGQAARTASRRKNADTPTCYTGTKRGAASQPQETGTRHPGRSREPRNKPPARATVGGGAKAG